MKDITKEYSNSEITVVWKPALCRHSTVCWTQLITVFDPRKHPWIDMSGAETGRIKEQVKLCPSGALTFYENGHETKQTSE